MARTKQAHRLWRMSLPAPTYKIETEELEMEELHDEE